MMEVRVKEADVEDSQCEGCHNVEYNVRSYKWKMSS